MMEEEGEESSEAEEINDSDNMFRKELRKTFTLKPCGNDHLGLYRGLARGLTKKKTVPNAEHVMCDIGIHLKQNPDQFPQLLSRLKTTFDDELRKSLAFFKLRGGEFQIHVASSLYQRQIIVIEPDFRIKHFGQEYGSSRPIYLCIENGSAVGFLRPRQKGTTPVEILSLLSSISQPQPMEPASTPSLTKTAGLKRKKAPSKLPQRKKRQKTTDKEPLPFIEANSIPKKPNTRQNHREQAKSCNHQKPDNDGTATCCTSKKVSKPAPPARCLPTRQCKQKGRSDAQVVKRCPNPLKRLSRVHPPKSRYKNLWECPNCGKFMPKYDAKRHLNVKNDCARSTNIKIPQKVVQGYLKIINTKDGKRFKCTSCNTFYSSAKNHRVHVRLIHEKQYAPYKCELCDQAFIKKCKYVQHTNSNACQKKEIIKKIWEEYAVEIKSDNGTIRYKCKKCNVDFALPQGLRRHVTKGRCKQTPASGAVVKKRNVCRKQCSKCKAFFSSQKNLDKHLNSKINVCERNIENQRLMEEYGRQVIRGGKEKYICIKCDYAYTSMSVWKKHVLEKHKDAIMSNMKCNEAGNNSLETATVSGLSFKQPGKFVCNKCGHSYSSNFALQRHANSATGKCNRLFKYKDFLQQSVRVETNDEGESKIVLQCYKCDEPFRTTDALMRHAMKSSCSDGSASGAVAKGQKNSTEQIKSKQRATARAESKNEYKCMNCGTSFTTLRSFKRHCSNQSSCERAQRYNKFLQTHVEQVLSETNVLKYKCRQCERTFSTIDHLKRHLTRNIQPINSNLNQSGSTSTFNYTCNIGLRKSAECSKGPAVKRHRKKSTKPKICKCDICSNTFTELRSLLRHQRNQCCLRHYPCTYCHTQFLGKSALSRHKCPFDPETEKYTCEFCGELFTSKLEFDEHINWHNQKRDLVCDRCNARFSKRKDLANHIRRRHGKKRICDLCGKEVPSHLSDRNLLNHSRECYKELCLGNLEKGPYDMVKCSFCEEKKVAFDYYSHMHWEVITSNRLHMRLPFPCSKCACAFQCKNTLALHAQIHVPVEEIQKQDREIKCEYCERVFGQQHHLARHLKSCKKRKEQIRYEEMITMLAKTFPMPTERLYHCHRCNETADSREDMMEHCSKAHGIRVPNDVNDVVSRIKTQISDCGLYSCYVCNQRFLCYVEQRMQTRICEDRFGTKIPQADSP